MQKIVPIKLADDADLRATIESFRIIQEKVSEIAFDKKCYSPLDLHRACYPTVKGWLKSQLTCTAIRSVASEYARIKRRRRRVYGPVHFSKPRALFLIGKSKRDACPPRRDTIRVWTIAGRKDIPCSIPARFKDTVRDASSCDTLAVSIKKGRLVATLSITVEEPKRNGTMPAGVAVRKNEVAAVSADGRSVQIITTAQNVMEETTRKTRKRLEKRQTARKADGHETRSVRRAIKRLSRKRHLRTRLFCHTAASQLVGWAGNDAILVMEDLRKQPPSRRRRRSTSPPHFYEMLRRRIEEKAQDASVTVFYVNIAGDGLRCAVCGAAGSVKKGVFSCGACGSTTPVSRNSALNVRNKFTVTRPWAAVSQS